MRERADGAVETEVGEARCLTSPRAEAGTPEQALGLGVPEAALVGRYLGHFSVYRPFVARHLNRYFRTTSVVFMPRALWSPSEHHRA